MTGEKRSTSKGVRVITAKRIVSATIIAAALICLALSCGCASPNAERESTNSSAGVGSAMGIEELPAPGEFTPSNLENRGRVHVQVPGGYKYSEGSENVEPYTGKQLELETVTVDLGEKGSLRITVDDVGFFDWWYSGSMYGTASVAEYVESAAATGHGSSWPISVGGHDATVLVQGSATEGGETSGDAFVFLDGATVALSAVLPDGKAREVDAYSRFFSSPEVRNLLGSVSISQR